MFWFTTGRCQPWPHVQEQRQWRAMVRKQRDPARVILKTALTTTASQDETNTGFRRRQQSSGSSFQSAQSNAELREAIQRLYETKHRTTNTSRNTGTNSNFTDSSGKYRKCHNRKQQTETTITNDNRNKQAWKHTGQAEITVQYTWNELQHTNDASSKQWRCASTACSSEHQPSSPESSAGLSTKINLRRS